MSSSFVRSWALPPWDFLKPPDPPIPVLFGNRGIVRFHGSGTASYIDGARVAFDDAATGTTTLTRLAAVYPGRVLVITGMG